MGVQLLLWGSHWEAYSVIFASPVGHRTPGLCTMGRALHAASSLGPAALWMAAQYALKPLATSAAPFCRSICQLYTPLLSDVISAIRELTPINSTTSKEPVIGCRTFIR